MYDALVGRPSQASPRGQASARPGARPLSASSIASSTSSSSSSGTSSFCGDGKLLGSAPKSSAYLASIESLEDSDEDAEERRKRFTGSQGSGDSGVYSPCSNVSSSCPPPARPRCCDPHLSYMDRIVMEVVETERVYVHDLQQIIEGYLRRWRSAADCPVSEKQLADLFSNIEDIYNFNSGFLRELELCGLDPARVARVFVGNNAGFSVYTQYCTNYPRTVSVLTELMRQEATVCCFRERQSSLRHTLPLGSYLLKPVQRILKYHLLLQNIVKNSSGEAAGYSDIVDALAAMTGIAHHINNMKRRHEHAIRVQEIQSLLYGWEGEDLTTFGELCAEGTFRMSGAKALRHVFLFDKMLLITKKKEEATLGYKAHIMCSNLMLIESVPGEPFSFHAIPFDNPRVQYTLQARNLEQKREWTLQLKRVILENYNVVIPSHARQLVMELGQSRTDDEIMAEKSTPKRQHSAPEYLEKRKQERQRRKSETGLRNRLHRSRKSEARNVGKSDADRRERRASSSSCDRSQSREPSSTPIKIKERFGSWRRKSEPGCYTSSAPASPSLDHSKLSIAHDDGTLNVEAGLASPEIPPDRGPGEENANSNVDISPGLQVAAESDGELAESKENIAEAGDESKTLEDIVGQLLMENLEFQKILKRQQRHLNQRSRWVPPGVSKLSKDETSDDDEGLYETFAPPSPAPCSLQGPAYRAHRHAHMRLLRNEHKILSSRRNEFHPESDGDYVTLMYHRQSQNALLQVPGQKHSPCVLRSTKSADALVGDAILNADEERKSSIWVQNQSRLENEEQEGFGNYDNLERIWETVRKQQEEIQVLANAVEGDKLPPSVPPRVLSPNLPAVWLKQQGEHLAVSTQKSGSLPRSFQVGNETDRSSFRPRLLTRDGKPCSDRPFTIASDKPQEINFDDIERYIEQSNTAHTRNRFPLHGDTTEEDSTTEYATTPNRSLDELNVHPDYKIYRPSISLKYMISSVSSKLASLRASSETLDAETEREKILRRERRASKFVHAFARQYGNMLRQRIRNLVGDETEEIYNTPNLATPATHNSQLPIYKQGSSSLGARIAHCSDYANPRILFPNIGQKTTSDMNFKSYVPTWSSSEGDKSSAQNADVCRRTTPPQSETCLPPSSMMSASPSSEDFNVSDGSADSYYERSFEAIESLMETDALRDSAVFSDQEDAAADKPRKVRPPVPAKPPRLRPEERLVRGLEGISSSVRERRRELERWKASREDDTSSQHSAASTVVEVRVVEDGGTGGGKGWVRHVIGKLQGDVVHFSLKHT
ncbi:uncharacterized protein LOC134534785 isoform X2 [Bacillus rossius redtenbacheri]